ncbi:hypothetical protein E2C01_086041 [Portunus trituberculatus]|uniref:Uncharacterized protein n=1 Tax=Portunus trituberculatus TaxID=210409 RepID=A0A5B7IZQ3_PORTR|nr:hypothetical protein [Portunus trituberculatus]
MLPSDVLERVKEAPAHGGGGGEVMVKEADLVVVVVVVLVVVVWSPLLSRLTPFSPPCLREYRVY